MYTIWNTNLFLLLRLILRVVHLELYGALFFIFIRYAAFPVAFIINLLQFPYRLFIIRLDWTDISEGLDRLSWLLLKLFDAGGITVLLELGRVFIALNGHSIATGTVEEV